MSYLSSLYALFGIIDEYLHDRMDMVTFMVRFTRASRECPREVREGATPPNVLLPRIYDEIAEGKITSEEALEQLRRAAKIYRSFYTFEELTLEDFIGNLGIWIHEYENCDRYFERGSPLNEAVFRDGVREHIEDYFRVLDAGKAAGK